MKKTLLKKKSYGVCGIFAAFVIFASLTVIFHFLPTASFADITENGLFTLSAETKQTVARIQEPVEIDFYFSDAPDKNFEKFAAYTRYVSDFLDLYRRAAPDKIILNKKRIRPFSQEEEEALFEGIKVQNGRFEDGNAVFAGLVVKGASGRKRVIAALSPDSENFLEYRLSGALEEIGQARLPVAGVISTDAALPRSAVMKRLGNAFAVRYISRNTMEIPDDLDVLMLVNPKNLNEETLYAVDQYLMHGGRMAAFFDVSEKRAPVKKRKRAEKDISYLTTPWGVDFDDEKTVADPTAGRFVASKENADTYVRSPVDLEVTKAAVSPEFSDLTDFNRLHFSKAGAFTVTRRLSDVRVTPLLTTTANAVLVPAAASFDEINAVLEENRRPHTPMNLAVFVSGKLSGAFKKPVKGNILKSRESAHLSKAVKPARVILVADTDVLYDDSQADGSFFKSEKADNADFIANLMTFAAKDASLIAVRANKIWNRPFAEKKSAETLRLMKEEASLTAQKELTVAVLRKLEAARDKTQNARARTQTDKEIKSLNKTLIDLHKKLRRCQGRLYAEKAQIKQELFLFNVFFIPFLMLAFALAGFVRRSRVGKESA